LVICSPFDVIVIPFPFADSAQVKMRPALVISRQAFNTFGLTTTLMVTSALHTPWPGDVRLDYHAAGLPKPSIMRLKLFTIDNRFIKTRIGQLTTEDQQNVIRQLKEHLAVTTEA
jgi:mRNA-degrading endonuclease toxin of MazEF toxin-antitoxin module